MKRFVFKKMFGIENSFNPTTEKPHRWDDEQLDNLADSMLKPEPLDSTIPAGYTYLGQFIDHDISLDSRSDRRKPADRPWGVEIKPDTIDNLRIPLLDLETIYGFKKPRNEGEFPREGLMKDGSNTLLKLGDTVPESSANPAIEKSYPNDLPRDSESLTARIVDARNDENLAVAQIQVAFVKFHNAVVSRLSDSNTPALFREARKIVIRHYQHIVLNDFLPRIVDAEVLKMVRAEVDSDNHSFDILNSKDIFMPLEFAVAAFRMGHSTIRNRYNWNNQFRRDPGTEGKNTPAKLEALALFTGRGKMRGDKIQRDVKHLPTIWIINWNWFFDINDSKTREKDHFNFAKKIDTKISDSLGGFHPPVVKFDGDSSQPLPETDKKRVNSLPALDLFRGRILGLPTGQEIAQVLAEKTNLKILKPEDIESLLPDDLKETFSSETPLWYYLLAEAEKQKDGETLGNVGSWIVAETFLKLLKASPYSILKKEFTPDEFVFSNDGKTFGMSEMLQFIAKQNIEKSEMKFDELNPIG
jgi:hypothetical protein